MQSYHNALAANNTGLPKFSDLPFHDGVKPTGLHHQFVGLTRGGAIIARRVQVSASVANLMAEVAGIGEGAAHA